jgi:hypothetical protein
MTYLDVTRPPVQVHVQVLDGAVLAKHVLQVLLGGLLVHVGDNDDPALDGAHGGCAGVGARIAGLGVRRRLLGLLGLLRRVDVHLGVGHGGRVGACSGGRRGSWGCSSWCGCRVAKSCREPRAVELPR